MKLNLTHTILCLLVGVTASENLRSSSSSSSADTDFNVESHSAMELTSHFLSWVKLHGKKYMNEEEMKLRRSIWMQNHARIEEHNNEKHSYTLGHNEFSDMTQEEFHQHFGLGEFADADPRLDKDQKMEDDDAEMAKEKLEKYLLDTQPLELPDYVNWISSGAVTPVKNQGSCGSCWAFSTTGALEGAKFVKTGELVSLSEQNLLDCDHKDLGCRGGIMDNAFKFDEKSGGLCSEEDYPYEAKQGTVCKTDCTDVPGTQVKTFVDVPPGNANALLAALALQPVSIAVQADQFVFQFYKKGVLDDDSCGKAANIDHGVLAVGYGTDLATQTPYWKVKNSWGAGWGDEGYLKIARNSTNEFGQCAILKMASLPIVE